MSPDNNHLYGFADYILDTKEKTLIRAGNSVSLTPKTFELLKILVLGSGRIIEKQTLMEKIWADSFVEESNLTFTVGQLRKTLGDNAQNPIYIETVPRRGYRFIAVVEKIQSDDNFSGNNIDLREIGNSQTLITKPKRSIFLFAAICLGILIVGAIAGYSWYAENKIGSRNLTVLNSQFNSQKLSTNGKVFHAIITKDGKNIIYTYESGRKQSVWIRQLESSNNVEIIPASEVFYGGISVSPDGNFLYLSRMSKGEDKNLNIHRVSIFGGVPQKIVNETQGWTSISPDGTKISFVRCFYLEDENCSLWIADAADGKNERKIASRTRPFRIADNEISPDGKSVAFAVGQSENSSNEFGLAEVDIETGEEREITKEKFFNIKSLTWLPDKSGLLVTASRVQNKNFLIWQILYNSDEIKPLTNDSQTYSALSLDKTASLLVSTNVREDFRLNLLDLENPSDKKVITDASTANFTSDKEIIFSSAMSGNEEIWKMNMDGSGQRQLTNDSADDLQGVISSSDNLIYFASNRTGAIQIWRMNADGSGQTQITHKESGYPVLVSPDGKWIYYHHSLDKSLRRISKDGKDEQIISDKSAYRYAVSPDGLKAAFVEKSGSGRILKIISTSDRKVIEVFPPAIREHKMPELAWMPDGEGLAYVLMDENFENYTLWLQSINGNAPRKIADLGDDEISESSGFAVSPDGKSVIFIQGGWRHDAVLLKGLN